MGCGFIKGTVLVGLVVSSAFVLAEATSTCVNQGVNVLRQHSPTGIGVWKAATDKSTFKAFVKCDEWMDESLSTAVHETVHMFRAEQNKYYLASGERQEVPSDTGYFPPKKIENALFRDLKVQKDDAFFSTYISTRGPTSSSKDEFSYLLDELNAYSVDSKVLSELADAGRARINPQTHGLAPLMTYVAYYLQHAKSLEAATWQRIKRDPTMVAAIRNIWTQSETSLANACKSSKRGDHPNDNANYFAYLCAPTPALSEVLGRGSRCPSGCLGPGGRGSPSVSTKRDSEQPTGIFSAIPTVR